MKENGLNKATDVEEPTACLSRAATHMKAAVLEAIDDETAAARRMIKRGYRATEDLLDEAAHQVKHYPLPAIGLAFGMGALAGWLVSRNGRH